MVFHISYDLIQKPQVGMIELFKYGVNGIEEFRSIAHANGLVSIAPKQSKIIPAKMLRFIMNKKR